MRRIALLLAGIGGCITLPAHAQQQPEPAIAAEPATAPAEAFGTADAIAEDNLGKIAGREDVGVMIASADQRNTVSNNSVIGNSTTGTITIDGQAFQNLQGLAVINANSGNNVAINSAMNVTINMGGVGGPQ